MNVAMCIPTCGDPTWQLFDSMARFQAYHYAQHPDIAVDVMRPPRSLPVDIARSYLVERVLERDYDYLWFVDQDCAFLPGTLERLMGWGRGIVGALCMIRGAEACWPMALRGENADGWRILTDPIHEFMRLNYDCSINAPQILEAPPEDSLIKVDFTGCHCLLIERDVLEAMPPPWFHGIPGQEDRYFCLKAAELGRTVHVDLSVLAGHATGSRTIGAFDFMAHYRLWAELEAVKTTDKEQT